MPWTRQDGVLRPPPMPAHVAGRFYTNFVETQTGTQAVSANTLYGIPFFVPTPTTYTTIAIEVSTAVAGNCRLGIYNDSAGAPGSLVLDAGTVSTGTTGLKTIAISQLLNPGWYWLAAVFDAAPTVRAASQTNALRMLGHTSGTDTTAHVGVSVAFTYAALPTPFTGGSVLATIAMPRVMVAP